MDFAAFVAQLRAEPEYAGQIVAWRTFPPREARYADLERPLPPALQRAFAAQGIERFYTHQAQAIDAARRGDSVVVVTATASGKTVCYNAPVLEALLGARQSEPLELHAPGPEDIEPPVTLSGPTALYIFPTKALTQDQLRTLAGLRRAGLGHVLSPGVYDGDVSTPGRRRVRDRCNVVLTNPDMLHRAILPHHTRWARFFAALRYVVVDELHTYRGIFGSNTALVLRRLQRLCAHYGSRPHYICCSATIRNPVEHAEALTGQTMVLVDDDGSPQGPKHFLLWNPPLLDEATGRRRSSNAEARDLLVRLVQQGVRTIVFGKARVVAELIARYGREQLEREAPALADRIRAYRGGYLPAERREIERRLFEGELLGITSTSAVELGIDVGHLEACLTVGFPETIASVWQQAGRAGRRRGESLVVLIAYTDARDQYLMQHPNYIFDESPESAVVDIDNPYIMTGHLRAAAAELPLGDEDRHFFGELCAPLCEVLEEHGDLRRQRRKWYWASTGYPAGDMNLRTTADDTYSIVDVTRNNEPIGAVDGISGLELVHPRAIYLHGGRTYSVEETDLQARVAYVRPVETDYYTQAALTGQITIGPPDEESRWRGCRILLAEAEVSWRVPGFAKVQFYTLEQLGYEHLDMPPQQLETMAFAWVPASQLIAAVDQLGRKPFDALCGLRNVAVNVLPTLAMCERLDLGGLLDAKNLGRPAIFLYDRYRGGLGFVEKAFKYTEELMQGCLSLIENCPCHEGCPLCVGLPVARQPLHSDPDPGGGYAVPDKVAALALLHAAFQEQAL